LNKDSYKQYMF